MAKYKPDSDIARLSPVKKLIEQCRFLARQGRLLTQKPGPETSSPGISVNDFFELTYALKGELLHRFPAKTKVTHEAQKLPGKITKKTKQKSSVCLEFCAELVAGASEMFPLLLLLIIPILIWQVAKGSTPVYQQEILKAIEQLDKLSLLLKA